MSAAPLAARVDGQCAVCTARNVSGQVIELA
jgi:hypothetical protein